MSHRPTFVRSVVLLGLLGPILTVRGAGSPSVPEAWLRIEVPDPSCALSRLGAAAGDGAATVLADLIASFQARAPAGPPGTSAASGRSAVARARGALGLSLERPILLGFSWLPTERSLAGEITDPASTEAALRRFMDEEAVPFVRDDVTLYLGENLTGALIGRRIAVASGADLARSLLAGPVVPIPAEFACSEPPGPAGASAGVPIGRIVIDMDLARRRLFPLIAGTADAPLRSLPADSPLPRRLHAIGRLFQEVPASIRRLELILRTSPAGAVLVAADEASTGACGSSGATAPASAGLLPGEILRAAGRGEPGVRLFRSLGSLAWAVEQPPEIAERIREGGQAAAAGARERQMELLVGPAERTRGWSLREIVADAVPEAPRIQSPAFAVLEMRNLTVRLGDGPGDSCFSVVLTPAGMEHWARELRQAPRL